MSGALEFFATDAAVALLEASLAIACGAERLPALVAVAWQMRQRDTGRALALADEADAGLVNADLSIAEYARLAARLQLIRAEAKWLFGELDAGMAMAESALHGLGVLGDVPSDALGRADAHWLIGLIAAAQGKMARTNAEMASSITAAQGLDPVRVVAAQAALTGLLAFSDVAAAKERGSALFAMEPAERHPAATAMIEDFWGIVAGQSGDYLQGIRHFSTTYTQALASGQRRRALTTATNIGGNLNSLNDYHAALDWMQRALELARPTGWPGVIGMVLVQAAETLRLLERYDAAADLLREALALLAPQSAARNYGIALQYLADVELDRKHYASALESFLKLEQRAVALAQADMLTEALRGQARAQVELGQLQPALQAAHAALAAAKSDAYRQIAALRVLADIHTRYALAPPPGTTAASAALHYLQQALDAAASIEGYTIAADLLEAVAQAYADVGDTGKAFELAKQAIATREITHSRESSNRAIAMQVTQETERAQAQALHQRQLARAHAERADTLEQANLAYHAVLENAQDAIVLTDRKGAINHWNRQATHTFGWTLEEAAGEGIIAMVFPARFHDEVGAAITRQQIELKDTPRMEIMAMRRDGSEFPVELSVTSVQVRGQFECSFFIRDITQRRKAELEIGESLAKQLELADLKSRFVSMASHEFRTPLTSILSSSDLLKHYSDRLGETDRVECLDAITHAVQRMTNMLEDVLLIGTSDAGVSRFKPMSLDLRALCESIVAEARLGFLTGPGAHHTIEFRMQSGPFKAELDERWFRHIFGNLLSNAIKYSPDGGRVLFEAHGSADEVALLVTDSGIGLPKEDIPRLFQSFFRASNTGKISGTGLGLSIVKRAVELHGGHISVTSELGQGTTFKVVLPLRRVAGPT